MKKETAQAIKTPPPGPPRAREASPASGAAPGATTLDVDIDLADAVEALPSGAAAPASPRAVWPAIDASDGELEDQLVRGLAGLFDAASPLTVVTARVAQALSPIERSVLSGETPGVDPAPLRSAALMRVRVAAALASTPPPGTPIDDAALSALLAAIDRLLSDVSALAAGAAQPVQVALDAVRSALVKEAIDLSEAAQVLASSGAAAPALAPAARLARPVARTRVLSVSSEPEEAPRRNVGLGVVLALVVIAGGAFHAWRATRRPERAEVPPPAGAPSNAYAAMPAEAFGRQMLRSADGKPFNPDELRAFAEQEAAKGNVVREISPGIIVVLPGGAAAPGK